MLKRRLCEARFTWRLSCEGPLLIADGRYERLPEIAAELSGGGFDSPDLAAGRGKAMLVGHEPDFSNEIARLTGAKAKLRKGGLAIVDGNTLLALLRPEELAAIAALHE